MGTLKDELGKYVKATRKNRRKTKKKKQVQVKKTEKKEQLSTKDIEELMGMHKETYGRHRGAVRRK